MIEDFLEVDVLIIAPSYVFCNSAYLTRTLNHELIYVAVCCGADDRWRASWFEKMVALRRFRAVEEVGGRSARPKK